MAVSVLEAVMRDLEELPAGLGRSGLAELAKAMAREVDDVTNSAAMKASCSKELREALERLRGLIPVEEESDQLDELKARFGGGAAPAG